MHRSRRIPVFSFTLLNLLIFTPAQADTFYQGSFLFWAAPGYSTGKLDWNVADSSGSPNVLSELIYDDIKAVNMELGGRLRLDSGPAQHLVLEASAMLGMIRDGTSHDRDWNADNRTDLYSYSTSEINDKRLDRTSASIGYEWTIDSKFAITPMAGWDRRRQMLVITNGVQQVPATGAFAGLNSAYDATWESFWLGAEGSFQFLPGQYLDVRGEYHVANYAAEASWNLRADFVQPDSFRQDADHGHGTRLRAAYRWEMVEHWQLMLAADWEEFEVKNGRDRVYLVASPSIVDSPLNAVHWHQLNYSLGLAWRF